MARRREAPKLPTVIERFLKALVVTNKAVALYPPSSNIPLDTANDAAEALRGALGERPELRLVVGRRGLFYNEVPVFPESPTYDAFAFELYNRKLADVRFHAGADAKDIVSFLSVLRFSPEEIEGAGGFEARLWELGVGTITVTEAHVSLVDAGALAAMEAGAESASMSRADIDELLAAAYGGRARDQITIARFIGDRESVASYLSSTFAEGGLTGLLQAGDRFAELAEVAYEVGTGENRYELLRSLGQALDDLDPDLRRSLLLEQVLPEARTSEAMASVVRQLDIDEVCRMLVDGMEESQASREGLARAIRTLALISLADREEVVSAAGAALRGGGFGEGVVSDVLEMTAPSRLTVRERSATAVAQDRPVDAIFRLMDLAPTPHRDEEEPAEDPDVAALRVEARRGLTDGDVIMALVSLVALDPRSNQFASTMSVLEDSLDLLIERGEIEVAADTADALGAAAKDEQLEPEQRERLLAAVGKFTKPTDVRALAHALRLFKPGSPEYEAARRLLDTLGALAIEPMLEQLADEPDMAVRKSIIDVLCEMAPGYINELGAHARDPRWFVVRNVVAILGSTRSSAVLPYLERTVRHADARVRREATRACAGISDRLAHEMLIAGLSDEDAQNVQLAARYLGSSGVRGAVGVLEQVAKGEGRGNRDTGPRVEAIEAIGRLGASEALPTLEALAGKRAIMRGARVRELKAAAESAIARIKGGGAT